MDYLWGIDLGGTKIEAVVLDSKALDRPVARMRIATEAEQGYEHVRYRIGLLVKMVATDSGLPLPSRIGLGTPGAIEPKTGVLKNCNAQCLNGQRLREDLEADLGMQVVTANDANCFTLAEATLGAGRGYETVFGVILGTGVGGGIVIDGHVLNGCHGIAGEWGQIVLDPSGPSSSYGTRGTIEVFISGTGLQHYYAAQTGEERKLDEIVARVAEDRAARATVDRLTDNFAKAIGIIIDVLDPHAIILGGGVGNIEELYSEETRRKITGVICNPTFDAALLKPSLGDSAGVFGAAMLLRD